jgi:glycine/D-amino acid oxidase-like deaminating enzyme/nitrite reductase/ring-hydroxylating ferredoxin subunit
MDSGYDLLPGTPESLWLATTPDTDFPPLTGDLTVDVAIVGGGLAGLTAATLLREEGRTVAVIEAGRIVKGVTGHTTAKITSLHTLIYHYLVRQFGRSNARAYGEANEAAIGQVATLVLEHGIRCDFKQTRAFTWSEDPRDLDQLEAEADAARSLRLPAAFTRDVPLPFPVAGAVRFSNQAQFHPRSYLLALAQKLPGDGSHVFEKTRALDARDGEPATVTTDSGTVSAKDVIIASHFPLGDKLYYASRLTPRQSYVLAVRTAQPLARELASSMLISADSSRSIRTQPSPDGDLLLVGGEGHRTGEGGNTVERYERLEQWTRDRFGEHEVIYRWSTEDYRTIDRVPYIGRAFPGSAHLFVATGFGGWGMTNSTVAGMLLRDLILGRENPWAGVYSPNRIKLKSVGRLLGQGADVARHFVGDRLESATAGKVAPGEGAVIKTEHDGQVALYRAKDGTETRLSPVCTHLGCQVAWNPAEKSWDCPCHGSRFTATGEILHGPALKPLSKAGES